MNTDTRVAIAAELSLDRQIEHFFGRDEERSNLRIFLDSYDCDASYLRDSGEILTNDTDSLIQLYTYAAAIDQLRESKGTEDAQDAVKRRIGEVVLNLFANWGAKQ